MLHHNSESFKDKPDFLKELDQLLIKHNIVDAAVVAANQREDGMVRICFIGFSKLREEVHPLIGLILEESESIVDDFIDTGYKYSAQNN